MIENSMSLKPAPMYEEDMKTAEKDFDSGIEENQREDQIAKNAPERPASLYGRQGRVKPDPETNPLADQDCEKVPTWNEHVPQAILHRACTCGRS